MSQWDKEIVERLRKVVGVSQQKGVDVEGVFHRIAGKNSDKISQDELLIAMSRINDSVSMADIKELHRILVGVQPGCNAGIEDIKVPIALAIQMLCV